MPKSRNGKNDSMFDKLKEAIGGLTDPRKLISALVILGAAFYVGSGARDDLTNLVEQQEQLSTEVEDNDVRLDELEDQLARDEVRARRIAGRLKHIDKQLEDVVDEGDEIARFIELGNRPLLKRLRELERKIDQLGVAQ